jgi:hypothetical protein
MVKKSKKSLVVDNLIKIMNDKRLSKVAFSQLIELSEAKWNKISNGSQNLCVDELSNIARKLRMKEIDIYTYPDKYRKIEPQSSEIKTILSVELKEELKNQVVELIFGKKNVSIIKCKEVLTGGGNFLIFNHLLQYNRMYPILLCTVFTPYVL